MSCCNKILACTLLILTSLHCWSQDNLFKEIANYDGLNPKPKLLYFHFDGCPPCKKMDVETLSKSAVRSRISRDFDAYSIFNFGKVEKEIRAKYGNKGNPEFVITSAKGEVIHRFIGFYEVKDFLKELDNGFNEAALTKLERTFCTTSYNRSFLKRYVKAKEKAAQVDSSLIFEYLDSLVVSSATESNIREFIHYGYFHGKIYIMYETKYFNYLDSLYNLPLSNELKVLIRPRLLLSTYSYYHRESKTKKILAEIEKLENGQRNAIVGAYDGNIYAILPEGYPSFDLKHEQISNYGEDVKRKSLDSLLVQHVKKIKLNLEEQNNLAWGIYKGYYDYSAVQGLNIIRNVLSKEIRYHYLDTYAALLFKNNDLEKAKIICELSIEIAKLQNLDSSSSQDLLQKINFELKS